MHPMFTAALFTTARTQKPGCSAMDEWTEIWYNHTTGCHSVTKRGMAGPPLVMGTDLESTVQSAGGQREEEVLCVKAHMWNAGEPICWREQRQRCGEERCAHTVDGEGEVGVGQAGRLGLTCIHYHG